MSGLSWRGNDLVMEDEGEVHVLGHVNFYQEIEALALQRFWRLGRPVAPSRRPPGGGVTVPAAPERT